MRKLKSALVTNQKALLPSGQFYAELNGSLVFHVLFSQPLYVKKTKLDENNRPVI